MNRGVLFLSLGARELGSRACTVPGPQDVLGKGCFCVVLCRAELRHNIPERVDCIGQPTCGWMSNIL